MKKVSPGMPRTSLLVPCHNAVRFLPRLRTQVDQLTPSFDEVLLADDASQDDTADRAKAFGFDILRLPKNLGPGGARNALARAATGEWIHFHDVDDEMVPDYLARVRQAATADRDVVFHFTDFIDEQSRALLIRWQFDPTSLAADPASTLLLGPLPTMSSFLRRTTFLTIGGFDEKRRCFEDGDLHFRLALHTTRIGTVPEVLEFSLRHDGGAGANQHYCFCCRLEFLEDYSRTLPVRLHPAIAREAERAAIMLLRLDDLAATRRAITLCERLGRILPASRNPLMRLVRPFLSTTLLLRWQDRWRQPTSTS